MQYKGKLYGKIANKYIDLEATADDFDSMKKQIEEFELYGMEKRSEIEELENENKKLFDAIEQVKEMLVPGSFDIFKCNQILSRVLNNTNPPLA